ncbi:hypothetical protein [Megalodesulfovibrio paquesii]
MHVMRVALTGLLLAVLGLSAGCAVITVPTHLAPLHSPFAVQEVAASREGAGVEAPPARPAPFLVILVNPIGLNYANPEGFFTSLHKHPRGDRKSNAVGHSWIILSDGDNFHIECGHTGEYGFHDTSYYREVLRAAQRGEENPARHLWEAKRDGRYEPHNGGNTPACAVRFPLTPEAFQAVKDYVEQYDYSVFSLTGPQCTGFAVGAADRAGIHLGSRVTLAIPQWVRFDGRDLRLWTDPQYASITFHSPDVLERSLKLAVQRGLGEDVTAQY